ncbi:MAG: Hsp20/alpha crystallin family protein [Gaiellaceae bacterium]
MILTRWTPFQELEAFERRTRKLFDELGFAQPIVPSADVYERKGEYVYELEIPGFEEKELEIEVTDHVLTVKGERAEEKEEKDKTFWLHERLARAFERRFELPPEADTQEVKAEFKKGILAVHAPKTITAAPKKVEIGK